MAATRPMKIFVAPVRARPSMAICANNMISSPWDDWCGRLRGERLPHFAGDEQVDNGLGQVPQRAAEPAVELLVDDRVGLLVDGRGDVGRDLFRRAAGRVGQPNQVLED